MKAGVRALGIAESFRGQEGSTSTLCGTVVRASRVTDGFVFGSCTVGGTDGTDALCDLVGRLDREDVRYVLLSGLALAWYNVVDLRAIHDAADRPVCSITYETSENGLEAGLREAFSGSALEKRLAVYERQPQRRPIDVGGGRIFVRSVGLAESEEREVLRAFTSESGRPEPLRVARLAARAADQWDSDRR